MHASLQLHVRTRYMMRSENSLVAKSGGGPASLHSFLLNCESLRCAQSTGKGAPCQAKSLADGLACRTIAQPCALCLPPPLSFVG